VLCLNAKTFETSPAGHTALASRFYSLLGNEAILSRTY
jgi:hypothetical protein